MPKNTFPYNRFLKFLPSSELRLKYNFENGGKLPVRKEGESDSDYFARWTPEDYKLLNQQILEAELNYETLNKRFLDEKNRTSTVTQKALELARELGYNDEQWSEEEVPAAKGFSYSGGEYSPRMISIDNPQDWEAIGMGHINDPNSFVNNLRNSYSDPRENYLYDWDKEEYILDEAGNKQPKYQRGLGCIGSVCGIYNTAGATQVSDFPTGFGNNIVKAGDPIFRQMSNRFLDENDYAGMKAMGFIPTDNPNEGDVMRIAEFPGSSYNSHSMLVNKINKEIDGEDDFINTFDWDARNNVIENPGPLSDGIRVGYASPKWYKDRATFWTYAGNTPQYEQEAIAANEQLKKLKALESSSIIPTKIDMSNIRVSPAKTKYTLRETTSYVPRTRKEKKEFANVTYPLPYYINNRNGGSLAPIIPTYYKSKRTPIYRDTTDAPPRMFDNGGKTKYKGFDDYIRTYNTVNATDNPTLLEKWKQRRNKAQMMNHVLAELQGYSELPKGYNDEDWANYVDAYEKAIANAENYQTYKQAKKDVKGKGKGRYKGSDGTRKFLDDYKANNWAQFDNQNVKEDFLGQLNPYRRGGYLNKKYKYGGFSR